MPWKHKTKAGLWLACLLAAAAAHAQPPQQVTVHEQLGMPTVQAAGTTVVATEMTMWGPNWKWAGVQAQTLPQGNHTYHTLGQVRDLGLNWASAVAPAGPNSLRMLINLQAQADVPGAVGGGMVFKFDLTNWGATMGNPVLLPGNAGWQWGQPGGRQFTLRAEPALAAVYFERNNPAEVRAFFYKGHIAAGERRHTLTFSWTGPEVTLQPTRTERLGGPPLASWPKHAVEPGTAPIDLVFLNQADKPAGQRGPVRVQGDALVWADGTPARFWGTNITAYALFNTPRELVRQQARRLAALGYNLVRLHHHDSHWVNPNVFGRREGVTHTQALNGEALDRLDHWVNALKDEGIYVWLDLHVQRAMLAGDNIYGFDEIRKGKDQADLKGYNYVNPTIQAAMKRFQQQYLARTNPYTGLAYKDEPAVVALLVTNENDVTHHFGNALLPDKGVPLHNKAYAAEASAFARQHKLPANQAWRSWEHGPSKLFLNDLEQRFNLDMVGHLRELGMRQPVATTNTWGRNPISSLPALTTGDLIDVHSYGGAGQLEKNPLLSANAVHWMGAGQVVGKPLTVTEWNAEPFPLPDRHALPLYVAAKASHQGWDALMHYAYSQEPFRGTGSPSNWHGWNDPSLLPMLSAAALLYREQHVKPATTTYVFDPGAEVFFNQAISAGNAPALRTAMEKGRLLVAMPATPQLPWLQRTEPPAGATVLRDPAQSVLPPNATGATTDTGELTRDWAQGTYTINTPKTRAALGWIGGKAVNLPDVTLNLVTKNASVAVQSLTEQPVGLSRHLLVSIGTRSQPQPGNKTPFVVEPLQGTIQIKAPPGLTAHRNGPMNRMVAWDAGAVQYANGAYTLQLDGKQSVQWVELK